jgi:hypothetical protein
MFVLKCAGFCDKQKGMAQIPPILAISVSAPFTSEA